MIRHKGFLLGAVLLTVLGLTQRGDAQSAQVTWDPAPNLEWVVPEYRVYRNGVFHEATVSTFSWVPVQPAETITVAVSSYGWRLNANLDVVWAEGQTSSPITYTAPGLPPPPPPPPTEQCAPDGYGNGVDEDGDGFTDEGCAVRPPPPPPPAPKQCVTDGLPYPVDSLLPKYTGKHGQVDAYIVARQREGWVVFTRSKSKSLSTVQMLCKGL